MYKCVQNPYFLMGLNIPNGTPTQQGPYLQAKEENKQKRSMKNEKKCPHSSGALLQSSLC